MPSVEMRGNKKRCILRPMSIGPYPHEAAFVARALELADTGEFDCAEPIFATLFAEAPEQTRRWFGEYLYEWVSRRCADTRPRVLQVA